MKVFSVLLHQSLGRQFSYVKDVSKLIVNAYTVIHKDLVRSQRKLYRTPCTLYRVSVGSLKMYTALEYSTRVVQEGGRRCKKSHSI